MEETDGLPRQRMTRDVRELESLAGAPEVDVKAAEKLEEQVADLTGDYLNVCLLLVLYTLQGIPMGLSAVFPLILKEKNVSYADLGTFSLNSYPFSLKLFWAPIVDAAYVSRIGRRKTWLIPTQLAIGLVMLVVAGSLDSLLYVEKPEIKSLTCLFFFLYFLCATQDIAVDGWALAILRKENVGYAATCNAIGQTLGYAIGFTGFMVLEHFGLITLAEFITLWGFIFIVVTLLVGLLKSEGAIPPDDEPESISKAYQDMFKILGLHPVRLLLLLLFTWKFPFAIADGVAPLKLQEFGVHKEHMAYIASGMMPVVILLPAVVSRWTSNTTPWNLAMKAYPWRVLLVLVSTVLVSCTPSEALHRGEIPWLFYSAVVLVCFLATVAQQCMFVSQMAFFARISDPALGGTYMTLLNTLANLGGMWPGTAVLNLIDASSCTAETCLVKRDGFYLMSGISFIYGVLWYLLASSHARRVQTIKLSDWRV